MRVYSVECRWFWTCEAGHSHDLTRVHLCLAVSTVDAYARAVEGLQAPAIVHVERLAPCPN